MLKMNENLRWLAINAPDWDNNLDRIARGSVGVDWFSSERFPGRIGFSREELRDARNKIEMSKILLGGEGNLIFSPENAMNSTYNHWQHLTDDITAYDPPGPTTMPECTFTTPDEDEAWREVEKKINPVWQSPSPHDFGGVCVFHGCRYSAYEQCYMCVLAGEAAKEEAKQPAYNPEDVAFVRAEGKQPGYPGRPASKYHVQIKGQWVDVYDILTAYSVTNPADAHAIKKMLSPAQRGAKDGIQDRQEAIASLERAIELEQGL